MSDNELASLRRKLQSQPSNLQLRARVYRLIIRMGLGSERGLQLAAAYQDPAAQSLVSDPAEPPEEVGEQELKELSAFPLQKLELWDCSGFTEASFRSFQDMELRSLALANANEELGRGLRNLKGQPLEKLDIAGSDFGDEFFEALSIFPLKCLHLVNCDLENNDSLRWLSQLSLEELYLDTFPCLEAQDLQHLSQLPLKVLHFGDRHYLTDAGLAHLQGLTLEKLEIYRANELNKGLDHIQGAQLRSLTLWTSELTPKAAQYIATFPLEDLTLDFESPQSWEALQQLKQETLKSLSLSSYSSRESNPDLSFLIGLKNIERLNLAHVYYLKDDALSWLGHLALTELDLSGCRSLTSQVLENIAGHTLKKLSLADLPMISNESLSHLSPMPLESLDLNHCEMIDAEGLRALPQTLKHLTFNVHKDSPEEVWQALKNLELETLNIGFIHREDMPQSMHERLEREFPDWQCLRLHADGWPWF